ncbi:unnamed protein product [Schistocephalus solidus]|uniref:Secreted protein n=1 Tax=Schistocephalus solidus TaxID=70667 RepID=A0A183TPP9_SCHSO|nr:unnamed protein product [Schistocephalus solidus]
MNSKSMRLFALLPVVIGLISSTTHPAAALPGTFQETPEKKPVVVDVPLDSGVIRNPPTMQFGQRFFKPMPPQAKRPDRRIHRGAVPRLVICPPFPSQPGPLLSSRPLPKPSDLYPFPRIEKVQIYRRPIITVPPHPRPRVVDI